MLPIRKEGLWQNTSQTRSSSLRAGIEGGALNRHIQLKHKLNS